MSVGLCVCVWGGEGGGGGGGGGPECMNLYVCVHFV